MCPGTVCRTIAGVSERRTAQIQRMAELKGESSNLDSDATASPGEQPAPSERPWRVRQVMAELKGESSNAIFEELHHWEAYLKKENITIHMEGQPHDG